jgi:hypothetical protein
VCYEAEVYAPGDIAAGDRLASARKTDVPAKLP